MREWVNPAVDRVHWVEHRGLEGIVLPEPPAEAAAAAAATLPEPPEPDPAPVPEPVAAAPVPAPTASTNVRAYVSMRCFGVHPCIHTQVPSQVSVVCGPLRGVFDVAGGFCILACSSKRVTPTEFERLGGKGSSKKWKVGYCLGCWTVGLWRHTKQRAGRILKSAGRILNRNITKEEKQKNETILHFNQTSTRPSSC